MYKSTLLTPDGPTPSRLYPIWNLRELTTRRRPAVLVRVRSAGRVAGAVSTALASRSSGLWDTKLPFAVVPGNNAAWGRRAGVDESVAGPQSFAGSSSGGASSAEGNLSGMLSATLSRTWWAGPATGWRDSGAPGRGTVKLAG